DLRRHQARLRPDDRGAPHRCRGVRPDARAVAAPARARTGRGGGVTDPRAGVPPDRVNRPAGGPARSATLRRWAVIVAIAAGLVLFFWLELDRFLSLESIASQQDRLEAWRAARPLTAAASFFLVYVAVTALSLPGAAAMTLAVGAVFGLGWGLLIVSFASTIGATLAFLASRTLLRDWVQSRFGGRLRAV